MCMGILPAFISVHHMYALPKNFRRGHQIPLELEIQITVSHSIGAENLNPGFLEEQSVLLTISHLSGPPKLFPPI